MKTFDLTGKAAIVTGGNDGIGRGIAIGLAAAGAGVCIAGRNETKNEQVRAAIEQVMGEERDVSVVIRGDRESDYQSAITAMEVAGELGFADIRLAAATATE